MQLASSQAFFWDRETDEYYLVNFQEKRYMKIAEKGSKYYELCSHLYCNSWDMAENSYKILSTFRKVDRLRQIDGCED
ncbi:hypothetical protein ACTFR8_23840 [Bacillus cereus group sp. MYBK15-3]|uniref:hypothetical protein n=1 Tax=Bacillus cereus group TaxID=86661 RepID=UPI00187A82C4|nr:MULTISPECIES: hypothetical protein [Bacillus cereus group]MBE7114342.1 hypothetical protein [Bacillus paranthracis]MBE7154785.1 hypothetical protein [Bacillus paranthracis]MBX9158631.1 hypothetical protein [Bacillus cereus]